MKLNNEDGMPSLYNLFLRSLDYGTYELVQRGSVVTLLVTRQAFSGLGMKSFS